MSAHPGQVISEYDKSAEVKTGKKVKKEKKKSVDTFHLLPEELDNVEYSDHAFVSDIRDRINAAGASEHMKKLSYNEITAFLADSGYIELLEIDGEKKKVPTGKGRACGIIEIERYSEKTGQTYKLIQYPENIQREIAQHFVRSE